MAVEIERKFLVDPNKLPNLGSGTKMLQGYLLARSPSIRVRIAGEKAFLTIKGKPQNHISRNEFEYEIPLQDGLELLKECKELIISKTRYEIMYENHLWELDIFEEENEGLIVAEIELSSEDEPFALPSWVTVEVSNDMRYTNANLISHPYSKW
ncbi:MAG: CYTH domain-containing protein [Epsilonproteobacteria bacterium]|nr:CYTH domain-containing protein [Campylobacterota bacterium]